MGRIGLGDRRQAAQIGDQGADIGVSHAAQGRIRHDRAHDRAVGTDAESNGVDDLLIGPGADAVVGIGRDIRSVEGAVGGAERPAAGVDRPALGRVTATPAGQGEDVTPARQQVGSRLLGMAGREEPGANQRPDH